MADKKTWDDRLFDRMQRLVDWVESMGTYQRLAWGMGVWALLAGFLTVILEISLYGLVNFFL